MSKDYKGYFKLTMYNKVGEIDETWYFPPEAGKVIGAVILIGGTKVKIVIEPITEAEYVKWGLEKYGVPEAE